MILPVRTEIADFQVFNTFDNRNSLFFFIIRLTLFNGRGPPTPKLLAEVAILCIFFLLSTYFLRLKRL